MLRNIVWQVGMLGDYKREFWAFALRLLLRGEIEHLIGSIMVAHHLIMFARAASGGQARRVLLFDQAAGGGCSGRVEPEIRRRRRDRRSRRCRDHGLRVAAARTGQIASVSTDDTWPILLRPRARLPDSTSGPATRRAVNLSHVSRVSGDETADSQPHSATREPRFEIEPM